jgi:ceramide glucosyltransferase
MLAVALPVGLLFCAYWIAQLLFVRGHLDWTNRPLASGESDANSNVTVIHPIKDLDYQLDENLGSWLRQDYRGAIQHIFSFQDPSDPAIPAVRRIVAAYPDYDIEIIVNPLIAGLNGKSSNMAHAMKLAKHEFVLFGDSDTRVRPDFVLKMVRPLKDARVGVTTCGQINIGGRDFWTRFFTFLQNCETDFNWAFLTRLGLDVGITGAAFAMRRALIAEIGGLETFGGSLLEDMFLGNLLRKRKFKVVLGPFVECHVDRLDKAKSFNYARRLVIGIRAHISFDLPAFLLLLAWYWILLIVALLSRSWELLLLALAFAGIRTLHGLAQRLITMNRILPVDLVMALFFDLFGTYFLLLSFRQSHVTWRGIRYRVTRGGYIEEVVVADRNLP